MNLHPAIGSQSCCHASTQGLSAPCSAGECIRSADQSKHTNDPTKFRCPQARANPAGPILFAPESEGYRLRGATKIGALWADAVTRVKMASPTGFEPVLPP